MTRNLDVSLDSVNKARGGQGISAFSTNGQHFLRTRFGTDANNLTTYRDHLVRQQRHVLAAADANDSKVLRKTGGNLQGAGPDRPRRSKKGNGFHVADHFTRSDTGIHGMVLGTMVTTGKGTKGRCKAWGR